jgi:hypothetical protein
VRGLLRTSELKGNQCARSSIPTTASTPWPRERQPICCSQTAGPSSTSRRRRSPAEVQVEVQARGRAGGRSEPDPEPDPDPDPDPEPGPELGKLKLAELIEHAEKIGVAADEIAALRKPGVSKAKAIDAINAHVAAASA